MVSSYKVFIFNTTLISLDSKLSGISLSANRNFKLTVTALAVVIQLSGILRPLDCFNVLNIVLNLSTANHDFSRFRGLV